MLIINFEGREVKGLSEGRYDETFAGEDGGPLINTYIYSCTEQNRTLFTKCLKVVKHKTILKLA